MTSLFHNEKEQKDFILQPKKDNKVPKLHFNLEFQVIHASVLFHFYKEQRDFILQPKKET